MVWDIFLASFGQLPGFCPLRAPAAPPASSPAGQCEKLKSPWLSESIALQKLKHQHVTSIIPILNPKHGTRKDILKKINSMLAETRTSFCCYCILHEKRNLRSTVRNEWLMSVLERITWESKCAILWINSMSVESDAEAMSEKSTSSLWFTCVFCIICIWSHYENCCSFDSERNFACGAWRDINDWIFRI